MSIIDTPLAGTKITNDGIPTDQFHALLESYEKAINQFKFVSYTVSTVPDPVLSETRCIYISDEVGGKTLAFSDGINWRRVQDRAIIS